MEEKPNSWNAGKRTASSENSVGELSAHRGPYLFELFEQEKYSDLEKLDLAVLSKARHNGQSLLHVAAALLSAEADPDKALDDFAEFLMTNCPEMIVASDNSKLTPVDYAARALDLKLVKRLIGHAAEDVVVYEPTRNMLERLAGIQRVILKEQRLRAGASSNSG